MAFLLNTEHVNWSRWVQGETAKTQQFYRLVGNFGFSPARNSRWRQLASELSSPDYRTNFDYQRARCNGPFSRTSHRFLEDTQAFRGRMSRMFVRTPSLPSMPRHSPTPSYQEIVRKYPRKRLLSRKLQLPSAGK